MKGSVKSEKRTTVYKYVRKKEKKNISSNQKGMKSSKKGF